MLDESVDDLELVGPVDFADNVEDESEGVKTARAGTVCNVCNTFSSNHHIHYGALTCFSCRAFFRRAHASRGLSSPGYACKQSNACDVTGKRRKKCQKCRYDKCIEVGMRPDLVLNDQQKRLRFRKMLERRQRQNDQPDNSDEPGNSAVSNDNHTSSEESCDNRSKSNVGSDDNEYNPVLGSDTSNSCSTLLDPKSEFIEEDVNLVDFDLPDLNETDWINKLVRVKEEKEDDFATLLQSNMDSTALVSMAPPWQNVDELQLKAGILSELSDDMLDVPHLCTMYRSVCAQHPIAEGILVNLAQNECKLSLWQNIAVTMCRRLRLFANVVQCENRQNNEDQFVHLLLLLLIRAQQDQQELLALLNPQNRYQNSIYVSCLQVRCSLSLLVRNWAKLDVLSDHLITLLSHYAHDNESRVVVLATLLLRNSSQNSHNISCLAEATKNCLNLDFDSNSITFDSNDSEDQRLTPGVRLKYTREEEQWLQQQLQIFQTWFASIPLGSELLDEFVMFSYDVPLSKRFVPHELATFKRRLKAVVDANPELNNLSGDEWSSLHSQVDVVPALALCTVKAESFDSGYEQLRFCLGRDDLALWQARFAGVSSPTRLKKVLIADWNKTSNALDSTALMDYLHLTGGLSSSVINADAFNILALLALFSGRNNNENNVVNTVSNVGEGRSVALQFLQCKLVHLVRRRCEDEAVFARMCVDLRHVDRLAPIFDRLLAL